MFVVNSIVNGDEIVVEPNWLWREKEGNQVVVFGYATPREGMKGYEFAKRKLEALLKGKSVELRNPSFFQKFGSQKLVCSVYLDGVDIANYFPEFRSRKPDPNIDFR